jgi:hypothetical protein
MRLPGGARSAHAAGGGMRAAVAAANHRPGGVEVARQVRGVRSCGMTMRGGRQLRPAAHAWGRGHLLCVAAFLAPESFFAVSSLAVSTGAEAAITSSANLRCAASSRSAKS